MKKMKVVLILALSSIGIFVLNSCNKDEDCTKQTWYNDTDGDGFGDPNSSQKFCTQPAGYVLDNTDFDDTNITAYPDADEICDDGIDNNGNGDIDECSLINQVIGSWTSNFNVSYTITNSSITSVTNNNSTYIYHILTTGSDYIICLNDSNNPFNADLYSKFVFTNISTNGFNLCQPFFDSPTQIFIENSADPTNSNDLVAGCGGFAWSEMTRN